MSTTTNNKNSNSNSRGVAAAGSDGGLFASSSMKVNLFIYITKGNKNNNTNNFVDQELNDLDDILIGGGQNNNNNNIIASGSSMQTIRGERPKFHSLFASAKQSLQRETVSVYSCGPSAFMQGVKDAANECGCLLHEETFEM